MSFSGARRAIFGALLAATLDCASATPPPHRVLHLCDCPAEMTGEERAGLLSAFAKLGYAQGRDIDLVSRDVGLVGPEWRDFLRAEIAARRPDLILASGIRVAEAARDSGDSIPVVFWRLTDPLGYGLVRTLARPGGTLTGFSRAIEKLTPKRLELLHEMLPAVRVVGFVFIADNASHRRQALEVRAAASTLGLEVRDYSLPESEWSDAGLDALFARMRRDGIAAFLLPDLNVRSTTLVRLSREYRLPTIHSLTHVVTEWGGLAAYATADLISFDDVASYADRILKGARPADLPVQEPSRFTLILNARAARDMNVVFPPSFLLRASEVIEK